MKSSENESQTTIIESISVAFAKHRAEKGGRTPESLKRLIADAFKGGMTKAGLARASGLSKATIQLWCRVPTELPTVKELLLQESEPLAIKPKLVVTRSIRIRLLSGVEIDFPQGELSFEFLTALNSLGGAQ